MLLNKFWDEYELDLEVGLFFGLICGGVFGLIISLTSGLIIGLLSGLVLCGFAALILGLEDGLTSGLRIWITSILVYGIFIILSHLKEALPFLTNLKEIGLFILLIIIIGEIVFLLDKSKPKKKENTFKFTLKRKAEAILETLLVFSGVTQIYILLREIDFIKYLPVILKWIGYIGAGLIVIAVVLGILYYWIKLNSLKYTQVKGGKN